VHALRVAFEQRGQQPRAVYDQLDELARRIARPPHRWTPDRLWKAYQRLGIARGKGSAAVAELVSIVRYELGIDTELTPFHDRVDENFAGWLARQQQGGVEFTVDQRWWLDRIANVIVNGVCITQDALESAPFAERGGVEGFLDTFGDGRAETLLDELNEELPA
jgi:type I restriction enzyme, R subunit